LHEDIKLNNKASKIVTLLFISLLFLPIKFRLFPEADYETVLCIYAIFLYLLFRINLLLTIIVIIVFLTIYFVLIKTVIKIVNHVVRLLFGKA
jgi:hypothetical protein